MYILYNYKPSVGLGLTASKSESVLENNDKYLWWFLNLNSQTQIKTNKVLQQWKSKIFRENCNQLNLISNFI